MADSPHPSIVTNDNNNGSTKSLICKHQIAHATTTALVSNRLTTNYTLEIHPTKKDSEINPTIFYWRIFDSTKNIDEIAVIIPFV